MFKGRRLSKDEMGYDRVLSQLVKLAFDMSYKLLLLNRLFNVEIHKNSKIVYFEDFSVRRLLLNIRAKFVNVYWQVGNCAT